MIKAETPLKVGQPFNPFALFVGSFIPNCLMRTNLISSGAKLCWARLAQYAGQNGQAWPSQEELAVELGVSERTVRNYLKELCDKGLLRIVRPTGQDRLDHKKNAYQLIWHPILKEDNYVN